MKNRLRIAIIGAGPAGVTAAIEAAREGAEVIVMDKNKQSGKKLRVTGGGRGNLSNRHVSPLQYNAKNMRFLHTFLEHNGYAEVIEYLHELGIYTYHTEDGWVYPLSNSAANTANLLEARMLEAGAELYSGYEVNNVQSDERGFKLFFSNDQPPMFFDRLIAASGGKAYPQTGSDGRILPILEQLGHTIFPVHPALAPIVLDVGPIHKLQGLRMDAGLTLWKRGDRLAETVGNIIFTSYGINGPGAMDLSHWISMYEPKDMYIEINFICGMEEKVAELLLPSQPHRIDLGAALGAFLQPKAVQFVLSQTGIEGERLLTDISRDRLQKLVEEMQCFRIGVKGVKGFDQCQVSTGGVSLDEVDPLTMGSLRVPGLFLAGEVLDVTGPCGGYNLHWAFASGITAGRACAVQS